MRGSLNGVQSALTAQERRAPLSGGTLPGRLKRLRESVLQAHFSLSGWKPLLIVRQLRHEWNSCPSQNRREAKFFRTLWKPRVPGNYW